MSDTTAGSGGKIDILQVLRTGTPLRGNNFKALKDLRWRQKYSDRDEYVLNFATNESLVLKQQKPHGIGTGATVWPAAHVLARYLERRGVEDLRILDLGAGTGAAGLAAARLGAREVMLTDLGDVLELTRINVDRNFPNDSRLLIQELDWSDPKELGVFDVILASECVLPQLYPVEPLADVIAKVLTDGTVALVAYEHRTHPEFDPRVRFPQLLRDRGLAVTVIHDLDPDYSADDILIWEIRRSSLDSSSTDAAALVCEAPWTRSQATVRIGDTIISLALGPQSIATTLWPSSIAAARVLLSSPTVLSSSKRKILELGAGVGLVAIAAAVKGPHDVIATDVDTTLLGTNVVAARRHFKGTVDVRVHDWGSSDLTLPNVDLIICSDCVYDSTSVNPLLDTLDGLFRRCPRPGLLVVNEQRTAFDVFMSALRNRWFPHIMNLHLRDPLWTIDCLPPHKQPPPIAAFYVPPSPSLTLGPS